MDVRRFFAHYFPHLTPARGWMLAAILGLTATSYVYREQPARGIAMLLILITVALNMRQRITGRRW